MNIQVDNICIELTDRMIKEYTELGFEVYTDKYRMFGKEHERQRMKSKLMTFNTAEDILAFAEKVGSIIVRKDSITIYDDYAE